MNNLIRDTSYRKIGLQLKDELFNWLGKTNGLQIPLKRQSTIVMIIYIEAPIEINLKNSMINLSKLRNRTLNLL